MFTGIIEQTGKIESLEKDGNNLLVWISAPFKEELKIDQSVAHNGVCLTVDALKENRYRVTAIKETLDKTNLKHWQVGDLVNLERCLSVNGRLDGHIVQGHVDTTGYIESIEDQNGSKLIRIRHDVDKHFITVEKGSITVNGISLTVFQADENGFSLAIIPYTWEYTNLHTLKMGDIINLEFDILGKYVQRLVKGT